jgi:hypothetical protein
MRKSDQDQLLAQILDGGDLDALRTASLARGLEAIGHRRRRRRRFEILAAVIVPMLLIFAVASHRHSKPVTRIAAQSAPPPAGNVSRVKYITAQELFALFPNRPIALIGKPGRQQVIFLDELARGQQP